MASLRDIAALAVAVPIGLVAIASKDQLRGISASGGSISVRVIAMASEVFTGPALILALAEN
ncbi:hypothetical protein GCM10008941_14350 [Rhizomicrobium palustre]